MVTKCEAVKKDWQAVSVKYFDDRQEPSRQLTMMRSRSSWREIFGIHEADYQHSRVGEMAWMAQASKEQVLAISNM